MNIESAITDAIIGRTICFEAGKKEYEIPPLSLGKFLLFSQVLKRIGIDPDSVTASILEKTKTNREDLLRLVAIGTIHKDECLFEPSVRRRMKELKSIEDKDLALLVSSILSMDRSTVICHETGIDVENKRYAEDIGQTSSETRSYGGKTLYGSLIDAACQRYGWTFREVVWGISFANLQLLMADQIRTIFSSPGGKKASSQVINADDPKNRDLVKAIIQGYKF